MASSSAALSLAGSASGSFPRFEDGDVLILLSPTRQYSLHSRTLSLHSSWFKDHLLEETAAQLASKFKRDRGAIRWRFDLQLPEARGGVGRLVPQVRTKKITEPLVKHVETANVLLRLFSTHG